MAKDFPYLQFMDKELMTSTCLEQLRGDEDSLVEKFQWAGCMLLKSAVIFRYLEPVIFSCIRALQDIKDEEKVILIQNEKVALEKAKQELASKLDELRGQMPFKD